MSNRFKRLSPWQLALHAVQLAAFIFIPGFFVTLFAALGSLTSALVHGTWSLAADGADTLLVVLVLAITALAGRFFCSFFCAFGAMEEVLAALGRRLHLQRRGLPGNKERLARGFKYIILAGLAASWVLGWKLPEGVSPWAPFGRAVIVHSPQPSALLTVGGLVLIAIALASLMTERFFCRYLCPLGAVLALVSRPRLYRVRKPLSGCAAHCSACTRVCSMGLDLRQENAVRSGDCINCLACRDICPQENVQVSPQPALAAAAVGVALTGCYLAGTALPVSASLPAGLTQTSASGALTLADGTYTGTGSGYRGQTQVSVTVENGSVTAISVDASDDDASFLADAQAGVVPAVISQQSLDVDPVSGATYSSNGILEAVAQALGTDFSAAEPADDRQKPSNKDAAQSQPPAAASAGALTDLADGTYTGTGTGYRGQTQVTVTVEDGEITAISLDASNDDQEFLQDAQAGVVPAIIDQQSLDVATVSGATFSSNGILEAVANALGADFTNPNDSASAQDRGHGGPDAGGEAGSQSDPSGHGHGHGGHGSHRA